MNTVHIFTYHTDNIDMSCSDYCSAAMHSKRRRRHRSRKLYRHRINILWPHNSIDFQCDSAALRHVIMCQLICSRFIHAQSRAFNSILKAILSCTLSMPIFAAACDAKIIYLAHVNGERILCRIQQQQQYWVCFPLATKKWLRRLLAFAFNTKRSPCTQSPRNVRSRFFFNLYSRGPFHTISFHRSVCSDVRAERARNKKKYVYKNIL